MRGMRELGVADWSSNAGGAMGAMYIIHASITECVLASTTSLSLRVRASAALARSSAPRADLRTDT